MHTHNINNVRKEQRDVESIFLSNFLSEEALPKEDISFRPLTQGLGFSKPSFKNVGTPSIRRPLIDNQTPPKTGLEAFYGPTASSLGPQVKTISKDEIKSVFTPANISEQFHAWFIDIVSVAFAFCITVLSFWILSPIKLNFFLENTLAFNILMLLFSVYYLFYFSIADITGKSIGKSMVGIKLVSTNNKAPTLSQSAERALLSMLILPSLFNLSAKLTDTKLVREK